MDAISDDDYEHVSDIDMSEPDSDHEPAHHETPNSTPPSSRSLRASDRKTISCTYDGCPKTFNRKARLEEHLRSHTNSRIFKCSFVGCHKDFLRETHLKHHVKSAHTNIRDYKCTWEGCDKSFATGTRLRRHFQAHEGREKYRCRGYDGCDETFRKHETLKRHILQVHEQIRPFPCPDLDPNTGKLCDKAFDTAEKLRAHQRVKHDSARFTCTECLAAATTLANSVDGQSPHLIATSFPTYSGLQAHIAEFHPPTCPYCPTSFKTSKELTRHLEIQHEVVDHNSKPGEHFTCHYPDCDRTFSKKGNLTVHIKTVHEKKKDFICGETELPIPENLVSHGDIYVHGCGRAFTTKASLEDHVRTAHLGMESLQVERRKKRKAEKNETTGDSTLLENKKRRPRKDKGTKKSSVLASLTGMPTLPQSAIDAEAMGSDQLSAISPPRGPEGEDPLSLSMKLDSDEEDHDEWNQLSGSMTLLGSRLYHNGDEYEYTDGEQSLHEDMNGSYSRIAKGALSRVDEDDEPFFDNFEHEPEAFHSVLDPALVNL